MMSVPAFVSGLVLVYLLAVRLQDAPVNFPATGWSPLDAGVAENLRYLFLPALTLAAIQIPTFSRLLRADMISTLQEDYILAARARGIPPSRLLLRHALRPSSFSLVTLAALSLGSLISGAIVVESLFGLPGVGHAIINSVLNNDVPAVQGIVMFIALTYVVVNSLLDIVYAVIDPRVRSVAGR
jgi:peptide/nickel transport system permease protein